jgi:aspartyl-tRNA synthetase
MKKSGNWLAQHHPFTSPQTRTYRQIVQRSRRGTRPGLRLGHQWRGKCRAAAFRVHNRDLQEKIFQAMQIPEEEALNKFGFMLGGL